jgi:hypothetical protein
MGSQASKQRGGSDEKNTPETIKLLIENIYKDMLHPDRVTDTITKTYCSDLKIFLANNALNNYSTDLLVGESKNLVLGIETSMLNSNIHNTLCSRLSDYYVKKINLIGTIISTITVLHRKLDRLNNGGMCFKNNKMDVSNVKYGFSIKPSLPLEFKFDNRLIFLDEELEKIRTNMVKKAGLKDSELNTKLSIIEIMDKDTCEENGGIWLDTRTTLEKAVLVPTEADLTLNSVWSTEYKKMEKDVYLSVSKLVDKLNLLVDEHIEPKMVNGSEVRVKVYRDRLMTSSDLDKHIIDTKAIIIAAFTAIDTQYLIINANITIKTANDAKREEQIKNELQVLKEKGKLTKPV